MVRTFLLRAYSPCRPADPAARVKEALLTQVAPGQLWIPYQYYAYLCNFRLGAVVFVHDRIRTSCRNTALLSRTACALSIGSGPYPHPVPRSSSHPYLRSTNPSYQYLAIQHVLAFVVLDTKIRSLFLTLGLLDTIAAVQRQLNALDKRNNVDLSKICDYVIDVLSGVEDITPLVLLRKYENDQVVPNSPDIPVTTLINNAVSQPPSLYQQSSSLRDRLMCIIDFPPFFTLISEVSIDPVTQLWDLFSLGIPLCFIYNLLNTTDKITGVDTDPNKSGTWDERSKKRAVALFAMRIRHIEGCEPFTVTELLDRSSTGLIKACNYCLNLLHIFTSFIGCQCRDRHCGSFAGVCLYVDTPLSL